MVGYVRRLPGPVVTMAGWSLIVFLDLVGVFLLGHGHENQVDSLAWLAVAAYELLVVAVCLVLGGRTPTLLLQIVLFLRLPSVVLLAALGSPVDSLLFGYATAVFVVVYAAYWWHGWLTYVYAAMSAGSMLLLGLIPEQTDRVAQTWFVVTTLLLVMGVALNRIVAEQERQARRDPITRLPNRVALEAYLDAHPRPTRSTEPLTIIVIDLDRFKDVNDTHGHVAGDNLLRDLTMAWNSLLAPDQSLYRVGGDEFLLVLPNTAPADAESVLVRLRTASRASWSAGATRWSSDEDFDAAFARADRLMYSRKAERRE